MKQLIVTGDDFGLSTAVNNAIEIAHRDGVLSATSLMVGEAASADAISRATNHPELRVGLHLVLTRGTPVSDPEQIPDLVTTDGVFRDNLFSAGVHYFCKPGIRRQLELEIRAQFQTFAHSGLSLDHVNAHNHMHLHPTILGLILRIGKEYGMRAMRVPYEPSLSPGSGRAMTRLRSLITMPGLAPWTLWMRRRLTGASIFSNDYIFGLKNTGRMSEAVLLDLLNHLPDGLSEIYFHPVLEGNMDSDPRSDDSQGSSEFQALISTRVSNLLDKLSLQPAGFSDFM
jgi:hopanoid biosynthesis associated protein HpnK